MQIRQFLNRNPAIAIVAVLIVIGICAWVIWSQTAGSNVVATPTEGYFTTDDGKTWFTDEVAKLPPFDKDGKQAVRVYLYKCGNGEPQVAYLERYTQKGKEVVERYRAEQKANPTVPPKSLGEFAALGQGSMEVKKPGDDKWVNKREGGAVAMMQYSCPDGTPGTLVR